jgi:hypothetical protein
MEGAIYVCTHEFAPEFEDELQLQPGDQILILLNVAGEDDQSTWWTVCLESSKTDLLIHSRGEISARIRRASFLSNSALHYHQIYLLLLRVPRMLFLKMLRHLESLQATNFFQVKFFHLHYCLSRQPPQKKKLMMKIHPWMSPLTCRLLHFQHPMSHFHNTLHSCSLNRFNLSTALFTRKRIRILPSLKSRHQSASHHHPKSHSSSLQPL